MVRGTMAAEVRFLQAIAPYYDVWMDWDRRLAEEIPFLERGLPTRGPVSILDAACGTGHRVRVLADRGYEVIGADGESTLVDRARELHGGIEVYPVSLAELTRAAKPGSMNLVVCGGNAAVLGRSRAELEQALSRMFDVLAPGGRLVMEMDNLAKVVRRKLRFLPLRRGRPADGEGEWLLLGEYEWNGTGILYHLLVLQRDSGGEWTMNVHSSEVLSLEHSDLVPMLRETGFNDIRLYSDYADGEFLPLESDRLIVTARRPE
ncbi:hypothetical protein CVV65_14095 [Kyrpidia spormannii]|uniref:Methyltransferase domain-containing protein n=1 Tax=Kyrpidia spormannii TaxID=2055160 RepID=A0A2K8NBV7_9BACL|nr:MULTISPECIES: class I SAM-dependent methyltransferase [Kyrpidia]ATY85912.1 hypothetical protein CVV65_14095 [Kyrpidia spormannii]MCL6576153.1 class I SAM-dependent methyltransferase [Kyrpidia sp.]